ncbi:MAG: TnpV protein [Ruminococcus sp.]
MTNTKITYTQQGDYLLPDLKLPQQPKYEIGVFGLRHKNYLLRYHRTRYYNLLTSGNLVEYLSDIDNQANELFATLVKQLSEKEKVTEQLKAENPLLWIQSMNNIRNRAIEIVNNDLIFQVK